MESTGSYSGGGDEPRSAPPQNEGGFFPRPPMGVPGGPMGGPGGPMGGLRPRPMGGRPRGKYAPRRKVCQFCVEKLSHIDFKDLIRLRRYLSDRAKIEPRRKTGTCAKHQRRLSIALKRAREIALLPFTGEHLRQMGGVIMPIPGLPMVPERAFPPRDSFGPGGSQPGGARQAQEQFPARQDAPPDSAPVRVDGPVESAPVEASAEPAVVEAQAPAEVESVSAEASEVAEPVTGAAT